VLQVLELSPEAGGESAKHLTIVVRRATPRGWSRFFPCALAIVIPLLVHERSSEVRSLTPLTSTVPRPLIRAALSIEIIGVPFSFPWRSLRSYASICCCTRTPSPPLW